ncbi:MAG: tetratricopeptide repeat protein [Alphaproteobacteria bacterium]|nr:tetratricopeptide repeat protein [Alphaproteobacteria bacterium]
MHRTFIRWSFSLLAVLFVISCTNHQNNMPNIENLSEKAQNQLLRVAESMKKAGDCGTAIKFYKDIVYSEPQNSQANIGLAQCLVEMKKYSEASEVLNHFLLDQPHNTQVRMELGKVYIAGHNPEMALNEFILILSHDPQSTSAQNGVGVCNDFLGQHQKAQNSYYKALETTPNHHGILANLGLSYILDGKYEKGINILEPLAKRFQATPRDRQNLALAYGLSGNMGKAAQLFRIDLDDTDVRTNIAYIHVLQSSSHASKIEAIYPGSQKPEAISSSESPQPILPSKPLEIQPLSSNKTHIKKP